MPQTKISIKTIPNEHCLKLKKSLTISPELPPAAKPPPQIKNSQNILLPFPPRKSTFKESPPNQHPPKTLSETWGSGSQGRGDPRSGAGKGSGHGQGVTQPLCPIGCPLHPPSRGSGAAAPHPAPHPFWGFFAADGGGGLRLVPSWELIFLPGWRSWRWRRVAAAAPQVSIPVIRSAPGAAAGGCAVLLGLPGIGIPREPCLEVSHHRSVPC